VIPAPLTLQSILDSQRLSEGELNSLRSLRQTVEAAVSKLNGSPRFYYGGSFGKGTMVKARYDLDIVVYWPYTTNFTIKDIFEAVGGQILGVWNTAHPKTVCWETNFQGGFHIDVVPGRALDANFHTANLYRNDTKSYMKTSLKEHIDTVKDSGRRPVIRLMKTWRELQNVPFKKSFALELMTIYGCLNYSTTDLAAQMIAALTYIRDNIETINLIDPANSNNSLSDDISVTDRYYIKLAANKALGATSWDRVFFG
jgi:hypothetical protein